MVNVDDTGLMLSLIRCSVCVCEIIQQAFASETMIYLFTVTAVKQCTGIAGFVQTEMHIIQLFSLFRRQLKTILIVCM